MDRGVCGYVDTHCNIPNILEKFKLSSFNELKDQHIKKVKNEEFQGCLSVSSDSPSRSDTLKIVDMEPLVWGCCGIHPLYAEQYTPEDEHAILEFMKHPKAIAYGEIGLDYHDFGPEYNYAKPELQHKIFKSQLNHALSLKKPIVIHTREAEEDTMKFMKEFIPQDWKIHVHCYTDSLAFAKKLLAEWQHLYLGFTGVITFKNSTEIQKVVKEIPLDKLLLETDGPFMPPTPFRGKTAHPGHIPYIVQKVSELKGITIEEVYRQTRENTVKMYGI